MQPAATVSGHRYDTAGYTGAISCRWHCFWFSTGKTDNDELIPDAVNLELAQVQALLNQKKPNADKALKILRSQSKKGNISWLNYHYSGVAELMLSNFDKASQYLLKAIEKGSDQPETFHSLSVSEFNKGNTQLAIQHAREALSLNDSFFEAWLHLGDVYRSVAQLEEALKCFSRANQLNTKHAGVAFRIGRIYDDQGDKDKALELYDITLQLDSDHLEALASKGAALTKLRQFEDAVVAFDELSTKGPHAELGAMLGLAELYKTKGEYDKALELYESAIERNNGIAALYVNYALCLQDVGEFTRSEEMYLKALEINPHQYESFSSFLMGLHYNPERSSEEIFNEHLKWDELFALKSEGRPVPTNTDPDKKIRLGFISGGFRRHPVGWMIINALEYLPEDQFEIYCYTANSIIDSNTNKIYSLSDSWKSVVGFSDQVVADMIRDDEVDILIELSGHSEDSRLKVISLEPAPITIKWVGGLFNTTGLSTMDFLITDPIENPEGSEEFYTEKLIRLPNDYICYSKPDYLPDAASLPADLNDYITFGCFNNPSKINPVLLEKWADILHAVPGSVLFLKSKQYGTRSFTDQIANVLGAKGIDRSRLVFEAESPHVELLEAYNRVDIALDPWPYSGGLTTIEALMMGVPVITYPGPTFAGRHAASHVFNAGYGEFIADSWQQYQEIVVDLATDRDRLRKLRAEMREKVEASPVMNGPRFALHFGDAMRTAWMQYVDGLDAEDEKDWREHISVSPNNESQLPGKRKAKERTLKDVVLTTEELLKISLPDTYKSISTFAFSELGRWEDPEVELLSTVIKTGNSVIDVGAGYGAFTLSSAKYAGSEGSVWAFEPVHSARKHLEKSARLNEFDHVNVLHKAAGDVNGRSKISFHDKTEWSGLDPEKGVAITTITIDYFLKKEGISSVDLLKIDVSGKELKVLEGANQFLETCSPILIISLDKMEDPGATEVFLQKKGYGIYQYLPGLNLLHQCEIGDISANRNLVAFKTDKKEQLDKEGLLFRFDEQAARNVSNGRWEQVLESQNWTESLIEGWSQLSSNGSNPFESSYIEALNIACEAEYYLQGPNEDSHKAASLFLHSSQLLTDLFQQNPNSLAVVFTLSRVLKRIDNRADASFLLKQFTEDLLIRKHQPDLSLPFLLPEAEMEMEKPGISDLENWIRVKSLEAWLFTKEWSSYYLSEQEKEYIGNLKGNTNAGERTRILHRMMDDMKVGKVTPVRRNITGRYVHIMFNHVYAKAFSDLIEYVNKETDQEHWVYVNVHRAIESYGADIDNNAFSKWFDSQKHLEVVINKCLEPDIDGVFIHGLFFPWQKQLVEALSGKKHLSWVIWGGDLYTPIKSGNPLHELVANFDAVLGSKDDLKVFSQAYSTGEGFEFAYTYPGLYGENLKVDTGNKSPVIIVGNSGDASNNHMEILRVLSGMSDIQEYELILPMSYNADPSYVEAVTQEAQNFGLKSLRVLDTFIKPEEYLNLMAQSSMLVTAHHRQQSLGNIMMSIYAGNATVLRKHIELNGHYIVNPAYSFLKSFGLEFQTFEELQDATSVKEMIDRAQGHQSNQQAIKEHFNLPARAEQLIQLTKALKARAT